MFNELGARLIEREREKGQRKDREREREERISLPQPKFRHKTQYFPLEHSKKYRAIPITASSEEWEREESVTSAQTWREKKKSKCGTISFLKEDK